MNNSDLLEFIGDPDNIDNELRRIEELERLHIGVVLF